MVFSSYDTRILSYTLDPTEIHRKRRQKRKEKRRDEDGMQRAHLRRLSNTNGNCECYRTKCIHKVEKDCMTNNNNNGCGIVDGIVDEFRKNI